MFIESICNDEEVLEQNYRYKMMYSPDYVGMNADEVLCSMLDAWRNLRSGTQGFQRTHREIH